MTGNQARPGRPPRLSREIIVATALDSDLSSLTMRELAAKLGVAHSALYRWVRDRAGLLHLISEYMVERIIPTHDATPENWQEWLAGLAWAMHDEFLAVPGYAVHLSEPHEHNPESFARLRGKVIAAFVAGGADAEMAEQSWAVFGLGVVQWLAARQSGHQVIDAERRFDLFVDALLRGLPTRADPDSIALRVRARSG